MADIREILSQRIMVLDGAMGTMIQRQNLHEEDFRGEIFADHSVKLEGNNDLLTLTRPEIIAQIHREYLEAGADIIETCTFNAQAISQADYKTTKYIREINLAAARIARIEADHMSLITPDKPRFVAGSIGPTGKTASLSPDMENPAFRAVDFNALKEAYTEQIEALVEGGVDLLLMETIFDTLNVKAALDSAREVFEKMGKRLPIMLSITLADAAGRMLAGQSIEAFLSSISHAEILSVGLNCSFGAEKMYPFLKELSQLAPYYVSAYPNAGLPDIMGRYNQTPEKMALQIKRFADEGIVNIVGGCCGSTPDHIRAIAEVVSHANDIRQPQSKDIAWLAGLDAFKNNGAFINVGERCNVAGSRKFLRLIKEKSYDEALSIARNQVRQGAMILDLNMDDAMIDTQSEMCQFLNLMASDPEVAKVPWMVDSSRFEVIEAALKCIQGRAIVNSLSLKEGESIFLQRALRVKELGAALVVMAFDEEGQATTLARKIEICQRAYNLLTERINFRPEDIIFDPNILTIATGIREHDLYAKDFILATEWIHQNLPQAKVSGGVSNLSFALRGNNFLREAMHAVFLYHAIRAGMDMAIVNPSTAVMYSDIAPELREALEDVILARREDATERLLAIAQEYQPSQSQSEQKPTINRNETPIQERLCNALRHGEEEYLASDIEEALTIYPSAAAIIEGPLMQGMSIVGELFGEGKMFLPQVVKSARTMKHAVGILQPYLEEKTDSASNNKIGKYLLATVKGDVHDIGKNITAVILGCNNFEVIDLGVMVSAEEIVERAISEQVDFIGLSGLITPSLEEMCHVAQMLKAAGVSKPLFIGGATTSELHTALKIAPLYDGAVFHVKDAAQNPVLAMQLLGAEKESIISEHKRKQAELRDSYQAPQKSDMAQRLSIDWSEEQIIKPSFLGTRTYAPIEIDNLRPYINWRHFYNLWKVAQDSPEAEKLRLEAETLLDNMSCEEHLLARIGFYSAYGFDGGIAILNGQGCENCPQIHKTIIPTPRQNAKEESMALSLSDFVAEEGMSDHIGVFAITISSALISRLERLKEEACDYEALLLQSLCDRLVEAASEYMHLKVRKELWGYAPDERLNNNELYQARYCGIRPAFGYPSLPDQRSIFTVKDLIGFDKIGISLTENGAMYPQSSVAGLYIASRHAKYFVIE